MQFSIDTNTNIVSIAELCSSGLALRHSDYLYSVENAVILGEDAILCTNKGEVINESSEYDLPAIINKYCKFSCNLNEFQQIKGSYLCLSGYWSGGFWHWCTEYLIKAVIAEKDGYQGFYLIPASKRFCFESLVCLGICPSRIIENRCNFIYVEKLYVPRSINGAHQLMNHPQLVHQLRDLTYNYLKIKPIKNKGNINYVSRRNPPRGGKVVNESELVKIVNKYGGQIIYMEDLSFADQVKIDSEASVLITPHGAGMVHSMFMPHKSLIIELFSPLRVMPCMYPVISALNHDYKMITSHTNASSPYLYAEEIYADICLLDLTLRFFTSLNL